MVLKNIINNVITGTVIIDLEMIHYTMQQYWKVKLYNAVKKCLTLVLTQLS